MPLGKELLGSAVATILLSPTTIPLRRLGGRRPGCSSGKSTYLGEPRRSKVGRLNSGKDRRAWRRPRQAAATASAHHRRSRLRDGRSLRRYRKR